MKLWISGEIQADIVDAFCDALREVEEAVNAVIEKQDYHLPLEGWDCIAIIRDDSVFEELTRYSKKKKDMDFRLKVDYAAFKAADARCQRVMLCGMLMRSLELLKTKGIAVGELETDFTRIAQEHGWT
jgi:hypothetical protein